MKIEPKYINGEPWCDEENCNHSYIQDVDCKYMCRYQSPGHLSLNDFSTPCIPALRRDRDQAIKEWDEARREICEVASESAYDEGLAISPKMMARQREWDCYDTPPKEQPK